MHKTDSDIPSGKSGLYVHIPFCRSKCAYCSFYSEPIEKHDTRRFLTALLKEFSAIKTSNIQTVYIGGGSPTSLPVIQLLELVQAIKNRFTSIIEFTIECNPGQVTAELLESLYSNGVNRLSIGAQSFSQTELYMLGRMHSVEEIKTAFRLARDSGFKNVSLDLIFAICGSSEASWQYSLQQAIELNPEHISAYALTIEPGTPLAQAVAKGQCKAIDESADRAMYEQAITSLAGAGYAQYEISNFAKPGFKCRHNMGYWQNHPYIGIGPSAASYTSSYRTQNYSDISRYIDCIETGCNAVEHNEFVNSNDRICETAVLNLRTKSGIDVQKFMQSTGQNPLILFEKAVKKHFDQGLLAIENEHIFLTEAALPVADYVLCDFAAL